MIHDLWEILVFNVLMHEEKEYITFAFYANVQFCSSFLLFNELKQKTHKKVIGSINPCHKIRR